MSLWKFPLQLFWSCFRHWKGLKGLPVAFSSPNWTAPHSLSLSWRERCSSSVINFEASSGLLPTGQHISCVGIIQTRSVALPNTVRQHFHWSLNITLESFNLYLETQREQQKKTPWLCLSMDSAQQTCHTRRSVIRLANVLQLPFTKTDTNLALENFYCAHVLQQFIFPGSISMFPVF